MGEAKRKHKIKPKLKVGDWVRVDPNGVRAHSYHESVVGKMFRIKSMEYVKMFEQNPSPWKVIPEGLIHQWDFYEEDLIPEVFMTAAHRAVENDHAA